MFGPVVTTEAHLAYAGARLHSINTAELSKIIEALSFLGACILFDSRHAASICLGTVPSRADVLLRLTCQRLLSQIQLRLRITMQHTCGHAQNLGNECHHMRTRWTRSSSQSDNLDDALQVPRNARTAHAPAPQRMVRHGARRVSVWFLVYVSFFSCIWSIVRHLAQSMPTPFSPLEGIC